MSKKVYLFSLVLLALSFVSCSETEEVGRYDNWRARNEAFIDSIANVYATALNHGGLKRVELISAPGEYIYYKTKTPVGDNIVKDKPPFSTSTITTYYKGSFIIGYVDSKDNFIGEIFDGTFTGADPSVGFSKTAEFTLNGLVTGMKEVLQRVDVGERIELYVPWQYGYGSTDRTLPNSSITVLAYSALIFDVQVLSCEY